MQELQDYTTELRELKNIEIQVGHGSTCAGRGQVEEEEGMLSP